VCESFPLQFLFCRLRFSGRGCDNLPGALPRYGWIQGFSYVREGSTGRPNMERLSHLPNSLDGLRVAFLSHFFTFSWRQPSVKLTDFRNVRNKAFKIYWLPKPE
jgi:hypothetical protein